MNSTTSEQRTEVIYALYKVWEASLEKTHDKSLCEFLGLEGTDTELIGKLAATYNIDPYEWTNFNRLELETEQAKKYEDALSSKEAWAKIAETYKMNAADRLQCRYLIEDDVKDKVEKIKVKLMKSRQLDVLNYMVAEIQSHVDAKAEGLD